MGDWKDIVREEFMTHADAGVVFIDCDIYSQETRLEVAYMVSGKREAVSMRARSRTIEPSNETEVRYLAGVAVKAANLRYHG